MTSPAAALRHLLQGPDLLIMPCCFDGLSARLIERAGFPLTFMSGFSVAAARLARPDTGLLSYGEILDQGRSILEAVTLPVIGDGDTGYGNALNVERTVEGFAKAGFAAIMIEDQLAPKRCGHTKGKEVVTRDEALIRLRAAVRAREKGADILILARTDARATLGFQEAIERVKMFEDLGADILFLEAPESVDEMALFNQAVTLPTMANMLEDGLTPYLPPDTLKDLGYVIAAYPLTLLSSAVRAMQESLERLKKGESVERRVNFKELQEIVGFNDYDQSLAKASSRD
ncbi:MAG: carboxyvinyl-carboxyphosphonate phosphorylmutase [Gammaproteobacteria bacterium]|nr:carboxyvinyl-carboxyphosphonate phosphorylmutase [Gammaproteobacteria bacterium]NBT44609.1 carboxyvinyl-carboxyphosphonate phosphorylmutase [Gammaproteobacteria bacterium]NBY23143.1 carboxyvinyl-carboxyphosphonate phosphorylmutase [Gammaproteobacteria bacterium]NDE34135.1 carboxyvinyl-carboxyphosphonate phosphorylmutase [Gammaproteobacteria bacterium]NDE56170.1 carboxyvinyl-carboxyphosphonate phosphorylmutase [Gammaproteobacteria bacterium]